MRHRWIFLALPVIAVPAFFACGGGNDNLPPPPPPPPPPPTVAPVASSAAPVDADVSAPAAPAVALVPGAASPDPAKMPSVKITAPAKGQVVPTDKGKDLEVKLDVKDWATATGSQHVHLILDNRPYTPIYDLKKPIKLGDLLGPDPLTEGQHVLVAFPSRANHESVKSKDLPAIVDFWVGKKGEAIFDAKKPALIYSRPKGDYKGDMANHVLVDFQVANVTLAEGKEHVHVFVSGPGIDKELSAKAEKFGPPFYLDNLHNGTYTIKLELMDGSMKTIPGPWNSTTRTIRVDHDAQPDPMPGMTPGSSMAPADAGAPATTAKPPPPPPAKGDAGAAKPPPPPPAKDAGAPKK